MNSNRRCAVAAIAVAAATAAYAQTFTAVLLDTPADANFVEAMALNDSRAIVGRIHRTILDPVTLVETGVFIPATWDSSGAITELPLLAGDVEGEAVAVNGSGRIAGVSSVNTVTQGPGPIRLVMDNKAVYWDPPDGPANLNTLATGASLTLRTAADINDAGQVVGEARPIGATTGLNAYLFDGGTVTDIGTDLHPHALNAHGAVVGETGFTNQAFLWQGGVLTSLHAYAGVGGPNSAAFDVNDAGHAVGRAHLTSAIQRAVRFADGQATFLGDFGGNQSTALAINNAGQIVGRGFVSLSDPAPFGRMNAFLYESGQFKNLNDHIPAGSGWDHFATAVDINDNGDIIGSGTWFGIDGLPFLLIRQDQPSCPCEFDGDAAQVDVFDLLAYLDLWFASDAAADIDSSSGVDVFDLLTFLDCWFPASAGSC